MICLGDMPQDAWTLFDSLNLDGDNVLTLEEFTEGCLLLKGPARSVDVRLGGRSTMYIYIYIIYTRTYSVFFSKNIYISCSMFYDDNFT